MLLCCVKCTSVLDKAHIEDVEVDLCGRCGGLWLDHGEIERLSRMMASELDRLRRLLKPAKGPPPVPSDVQGTCPSCTSELKEVMLGQVHVDYCPRCKGLFLDRGEIDAALAAVSDPKVTVPQLLAAAAAEAQVGGDAVDVEV